MKNIRLGNDISIKWYVYRMNTPEDFNGKTVEVHLLDKNDVKQNFTYKIEDGLISGVFYGKNQMTTGAYRLVLVENSGKNNMVTLDYVDAFILNSKMHNATSSGADTACNMKTQIVNLTSIMSRQTGVTNLYDYYTRDEVDEILKGYAKAVDLESYALKEHTHDEYALKTDIPDTSSYLTSESDPTVPAYVKSIRQSDIDAWNAATGGVDLSNYVTKNYLNTASYITAEQVTHPDYSNTYANIVHTHSEYLTEHQDLSAYAKKTELFSKDYNDLTNKPTIPSEYDDTQVRNLIAGKQDKLTESQIANLNADHSKYLTQHQTLPDYSSTYAPLVHTHSDYAPLVHTHDQYLTQHQDLSAYVKTTDLESYALKTDIPDTSSYLTSESDPTVPAYVKSIRQSDIDAWNAATGGVDLSNYVTKNDLNTASYITADQVTHPDYSTTYAKINHTHDQYLTEHQDLSAYAKKTELFSKDYNDLTNKPTIPSEYDDTQVRNLIAGKQDKLSESQIANLNADHSKYLTKHQDLSAYALKTDIPDTSSYLTAESDPTVPAYVKSIKQSDIDAWNAATGGVDLSNYVTKNDLDTASYITADQVTHPDYSTTYANINHTHDQYLTEHQDLSAYAKKTELFSKDYNDLTNKPTIPSEYDDTQVRNLIAGKQDKLSASQIANLNADHSKYLTQHQTLPDYSSTYAPLNHTHNQYAAVQHVHSQYLTSESDPTVPAYVKSIKQSDIDAWNAATGGVDLSNYVTKNDLNTASYITADQVTHPDYSTTYAKINHTHSQYITEHQDLSAYAKKTELFSKDYNDLTNKPTIPSEYDDTQVRNLIAGKQDKLSASQIANLNADHSKYLTQHQTLPDYSSTYAPLVHSHSEYATLSYLNDKLGSIDIALTNILEA